MPRRDDLIGLLCSLDGAMKALGPEPGHEARMRARLAREAGGRGVGALRPARALALVFCGAAALVAPWLVCAPPRDPDLSMRPLPAPPASAEATSEPPAPPSSSQAPPRWLPRRPVPALPILPPRSEVAPSAPEPPARADASPAEASSRRSRPEPTPAVQDANSAHAPDARRDAAGVAAPAYGRGLPITGDYQGSPGNVAGARGPALGPMGSLAGAPWPAARAHGAPSHDGAPGGDDRDLPAPTHGGAAAEPAACEWTVLDLGGACAGHAEIKQLAAEMCGAGGLVMANLEPAPGCSGEGASLAKVQCCAANEAGAQDPYGGCKPLSAGDGVTCTDSGLLVKQAAETCASWGGALAQPEVAPGCGAGAGALVTALCCPPQEAADPGPAPAGVVGDGIECIPNDALEEAAVQVCDALDLTLVDFFAADDCEDDMSTAAKYICGG